MPRSSALSTRLITLSLCLSISLLPGCSFFVGSREMLVIAPSHPTAEVFVDGEPVGQGTVRVHIRRDRAHAIMARVGDRVGTAYVGTEISTVGILDLLGGFFFLIPFIGIAAPGFYSLDRDYVNVAIPPE